MIGIFGGSFDPIHEGHILVATSLLKKFPFEKLYIVPAGQNPHKVTGPTASGKHRLRMIEIAISEIEEAKSQLTPLDFELKNSGPSYTILTLDYLKKKHPKEDFAIIVGNEVFQHFQNWYRPKQILQGANVIVISRLNEAAPDLGEVVAKCGLTPSDKETSSHRLNHSGTHWIEYVELDVLPFSSTDIRRELAKFWKSPNDATPPKGIQRSVWLYIKENRLYSVNK